MNSKIIAGVLVAIALVLGFAVFATSKTPTFGASSGPAHYSTESFLQGLAAGSRDQFSLSNVGAIVSSAAATFSGVLTETGSTVVSTFTQGGGVTASSTSASVTLAGTEFTTSNVLDYTINVGSVTLTLAASTTSMCPTTSGQVRSLYIRNATTTAASNLTIAGGTGTLLKVASTSAVIYGDTDGANFARLDITRKANTDCEVLMAIFHD